jgi:hypothetical protein
MKALPRVGGKCGVTELMKCGIREDAFAQMAVLNPHHLLFGVAVAG